MSHHAHNDDDEVVCRICMSEMSEDQKAFRDEHNVLHSPCGCIGHSGAIHAPCLAQWISHSGKTSCELCGMPFNALFFSDSNDRVLIQNALATASGASRAMNHMRSSNTVPVTDEELEAATRVVMKMCLVLLFVMSIFSLVRLQQNSTRPNKHVAHKSLINCTIMSITGLFLMGFIAMQPS